MKKIIVALFALACVATASAQEFTAIAFPVTTVAGTTAATNLALGWSTIVNYTNVTTAWNINSNAFVNTTNVLSTTNTQFADFNAAGQNYVSMQFNNTANIVSNYVFTIGRSINGIVYDTNNVINVTNATVNSGNTNCGTALIDMRGYTFGRLTSFNWVSATAGNVYTNVSVLKSNKKN